MDIREPNGYKIAHLATLGGSRHKLKAGTFIIMCFETEKSAKICLEVAVTYN